MSNQRRACIKESAPAFIASGEDGLRDMILIEAIYEAARSGKKKHFISMTEKQKQKLEQLIEEAYPFNSIIYLEKGWALFSKYLLGFVGFAILIALIELLLYQFGMIVFGFLVTSLLIGPPTSAAYYWVARRIDRSEAYGPKDFLYGFNLIIPLVLVNLIMTLIIGIVMLPSVYALHSAGFFEWYQEVVANPTTPPIPPELPDRVSTVVFLNLIPMVYLYVSYIWALPFVLFYQLNPWQALETSRRLVSRRWFSVFGLVLIVVGFTMFVALPLGMISNASPSLSFLSTIGLAALNPLVLCIFYAAFTEVTLPLEVDEDKEELLDHLID